ncbi:ATP-binding protein [Coraliomargarita algicola]|uniref:ATP-binding protein n=1 Tax=Coraliomargarita algicola TaxID=3092156 RepID=A0ABZ0RDP2_9BACT|nr:ATP-binding protein [Coraliomargarita sp. J2-16]WPJ94274.1 ATP-binding protein [Coraliomargarita sp. J2-16]
MKRIVLTGAECTGKSTLTQALSGYYGEPWTAEYVRDYVDHIGRELTREDLEPIAKGQIATEDACHDKAKRLILHDTNLLSSIIYANHYFNEVIDWVNECFLQRDYTLYLLCCPQGIEWQDDPGQRDSPAARAELQAKFKETLDKLQLPYVELRGDPTARFGEAIRAIDAVL